MPPPVEFEEQKVTMVSELIENYNGSYTGTAEIEIISYVGQEETTNSQGAGKPEEAQVQEPDPAAKKIKVRG